MPARQPGAEVDSPGEARTTIGLLLVLRPWQPPPTPGPWPLTVGSQAESEPFLHDLERKCRSGRYRVPRFSDPPRCDVSVPHPRKLSPRLPQPGCVAALGAWFDRRVRPPPRGPAARARRRSHRQDYYLRRRASTPIGPRWRLPPRRMPTTPAAALAAAPSLRAVRRALQPWPQAGRRPVFKFRLRPSSSTSPPPE